MYINLQTTAITNRLFVGANGLLMMQGIHTPKEQTLSHIARQRANNIEMATLMQLLTGMDDTQFAELMSSIAIEWLTEHTNSDEQDIYLLLADPKVVGWWKNHWHLRDNQMRDMMVFEYGRNLNHHRKDKQPPAECRRLANLAMLKKYIDMQRLAFVRDTYQHRQLEDSYAKLW